MRNRVLGLGNLRPLLPLVHLGESPLGRVALASEPVEPLRGRSRELGLCLAARSEDADHLVQPRHRRRGRLCVRVEALLLGVEREAPSFNLGSLRGETGEAFFGLGEPLLEEGTPLRDGRHPDLEVSQDAGDGCHLLVEPPTRGLAGEVPFASVAAPRLRASEAGR